MTLRTTSTPATVLGRGCARRACACLNVCVGREGAAWSKRGQHGGASEGCARPQMRAACGAPAAPAAPIKRRAPPPRMAGCYGMNNLPICLSPTLIAMSASPARHTPGPDASASGTPSARSTPAVANSWHSAMRVALLEEGRERGGTATRRGGVKKGFLGGGQAGRWAAGRGGCRVPGARLGSDRGLRGAARLGALLAGRRHAGEPGRGCLPPAGPPPDPNRRALPKAPQTPPRVEPGEEGGALAGRLQGLGHHQGALKVHQAAHDLRYWGGVWKGSSD